MPVGIVVDARTANGGTVEPLQHDVAGEIFVVGCGTGHHAGVTADVIVDTVFDRTDYVAAASGSTSAISARGAKVIAATSLPKSTCVPIGRTVTAWIRGPRRLRTRL